MVSGNVQGNGRIGGTLSVSKSAHWQGDISARRPCWPAGSPARSVVGRQARDQLIAVYPGRDRRQDLAIANGARIEGEVT
jgi:hypothetical protein